MVYLAALRVSTLARRIMSLAQGSIVAKGRTAGRQFDRQQIEGCRLRVSGTVLLEIISMVDELSA
jgi:hypothetical protein